MQPSGVWLHNIGKKAILAICLPVTRKKTAKYSSYMLLPLRLFNKHHTIQLPELFTEIH